MSEEMANVERPIVAHIHGSFFVGSETFIYQYISRLEKFKPVCVAQSFVNLDQFPFPREDMYPLSAKRYSLRWLYRAFNNRVLNRNPALIRALKETGCSLLHAHFGTSGCIALPAKRRLRLPLVTTFYGFDLSKREHVERYRERYKRLFAEGDLFLVEGPFMRERLIELGCPPEKIEIQRIAIPVRDIPFQARRPKAKGEKAILLFAGRFVEKKGLGYLIGAVATASRERDDFELRLIGSGPREEEIKAQVEGHGLADRVVFLGFLPYKRYLEELREADIFIHPSVTASDGDSEGGAPTVILEAQASGLPVLTTDHADIPNVVVPGKSALLSPERDWEGLAGNLLRLLEEQDRWEEMGRAGRYFIEERHDIEKEVHGLEDKYMMLMHGKQQANEPGGQAWESA